MHEEEDDFVQVVEERHGRREFEVVDVLHGLQEGRVVALRQQFLRFQGHVVLQDGVDAESLSFEVHGALQQGDHFFAGEDVGHIQQVRLFFHADHVPPMVDVDAFPHHRQDILWIEFRHIPVCDYRRRGGSGFAWMTLLHGDWHAGRER